MTVQQALLQIKASSTALTGLILSAVLCRDGFEWALMYCTFVCIYRFSKEAINSSLHNQ